MKAVLLLLRYFAMAMTPIRIMTWVGLGLLPVVFISGLFWPRVSFGFALWSWVFLFAVPATGAPIALRTLLSNRRLMMMPRFAGTAVIALFMLSTLTAAFLPFFAWLYDIRRFPDSALVYSFVLVSTYLPIGFILCGMQWGMQAWGILLAPLIVVGTTALRDMIALPPLSTGMQGVLVIIVLLGWLAALLLASRVRRVRPAAVYGLQHDQQMLARIGTRLGPAFSAGRASSALSLMMGYPATRFSVLRLKLLAGILGPLPLVLVMRIADFNQRQISWLDMLRMLMFIYLFSATVVGVQNAELVARLRLLWLRAPQLRKDLWNMLDVQHLLSQLAFLLLTGLLAFTVSLFSSFRPALFWHYPLVLLALNAHTSYYSIYAKMKGWGMLPRLVTLGGGLAISVWLVFRSISADTIMPLVMLEALLVVLALLWRQLGRARFARIDWQRLKPAQLQRGMAP